ASVVDRRLMSRVQQMDDTAQLRASAQIAFDERLPCRALLLRDARVPVSRQVYQHECVVDLEEVDLARAAGSVAHPRELLSAYESVEERRLADVGPPGKRDFRQLRLRAPSVRTRHATEELERANDERITHVRAHQDGATTGVAAAQS